MSTSIAPTSSSTGQNVQAGTLAGVVAAPSAICTVDGQAGRLIYRGYDVEDLALGASYEEVVHLLWEGNLPTQAQLGPFSTRLAEARSVPTVVLDHLRVIPASSHPLAVLRSAVSLLSHHDPEAEAMSPRVTRAKAERLLGQIATLVAAWARIRDGKDPVAPRKDLAAAPNFLYMLFGQEPDGLAARAMDVAFTLHAEHEFNASTFAARVAAGTYVDLHTAVVAAFAALKGPRHGGANQDVIEMAEEIGDPARAEAWARERVARWKAASREERADPRLRFPGFGHRVYKTLDPRARQLQGLAAQVSEARGVSIGAIQETVRQVVTTEMGLHPNVDYYSAGLYHALGIPSDLYTSIFAVARTAGLVAHYEEQAYGGRLIRPRAEYTGPLNRPFVPLAARAA
ncbi:MAG TPA: citrate/2-methylcitrate synthase [Longimicrobiaceae bacterium]|nr:citrate/2-methylcitrate synthase [Longimicrobiaceae bacterium]